MTSAAGTITRRVRALPPAVRSRWTAALASACLVAVASRPWGVPWLAWLCLVPLLVALQDAHDWRDAGSLTLVVATSLTSVAYEPTVALGLAWHVVAVVLTALPFVAAACLAHAVTGVLSGAPKAFTFALFWAVAELLVAQPSLLGRYALPLATIGYAQAGQPVQYLARYGSVTAVSLAILLVNAAFAELALAVRLTRSGHLPLRRRAVRRAAVLLVTVSAAASWASYGVRSSRATAKPSTTVDVAVAQPHLPRSVISTSNVSAAVYADVLATFGDLSARAYELGSGRPPDILVLPEQAWPVALPAGEPGVLSSWGSLQGATVAPPAELLAAFDGLPPTLFGGAAVSPAGTVTNAAFLWDAAGLQHVYDKIHLVPVYERGLAAGSDIALFQLGGPGSGLAATALICYDSVFAAPARRAALAGASLLVVLSDSAFAARSDVPLQHLRVARIRAVETGLPVVLASNTGPSALIDAWGEVVAASERGRATTIRARLGAGAEPSPYVVHGNWVGVASVLALLAMCSAAAIHPASGAPGGDLNDPP